MNIFNCTQINFLSIGSQTLNAVLPYRPVAIAALSAAVFYLAWPQIPSKNFLKAYATATLTPKNAIFLENGGIFLGQVVRKQISGQGVITYPNGDTLEGDFSVGSLSGSYKNTHGAVIQIYEETTKTSTITNYAENLTFSIPHGDLGKLSSLDFFTALFDLDWLGGMHQKRAAHILSNYLKNYFAQDPDIFENIVTPLLELAERQEPSLKKRSVQVKTLLHEGKPVLCSPSIANHATLLLLQRTEEDMLVMTLFNSGFGLEVYHKRDIFTGKWQTARIKQIPILTLKKSQLHLWLEGGKIGDSIDKLYKSLQMDSLCFPMSESLPQKSAQPIWDSEQKGENCSLRCLLAYLQHGLENRGKREVYKKFMKDLHQACLSATLEEQRSLADSLEEKILSNQRVQYKIKKLGLKIEPHLSQDIM